MEIGNISGTKPLVKLPGSTGRLDPSQESDRKASVPGAARDAAATGATSSASAEYNDLQATSASLESANVDNTMHVLDGNAQAQADLNALKAQGKLTTEVMQGLEKLATQKLAEGVNRQDLMSATLRNLVDPTSIGQGGRESCAAATVQIMLAKEDPAEYLDLVGGLASEEGTATLKNGETIKRDASWNNNGDRSVVDNLMQPAFMSYASGGYDNVTDARKDGAGKGLYASEEAKLAGAVQGKEMLAVLGNSPETMPLLEKAVSKGKSIPAVIKVTDPQSGKTLVHSVLVESFKDGKVTFIDKKGSRQTVPASEFGKMVESVDLPADMLTPSQKKTLVAGEKKGPLAGCGGGLFGGLVNIVKKALPIISLVVNFVPGLNVASWVLKGINIAKAIVDKNPLGALGGMIGGGFGSMMEKAGNVVTGFKNGGVMGALGALGNGVGGDTGKMISKAANVVNAAQHGNIVGAIAAAGDAVGGDTGSTIRKAAGLVYAAEHGSVAGMAAAGGALIGGETGQTITNAARMVNAAQTGNIAGAAAAASSLVAGNTAASGLIDDNTSQTITQVASAISAFKNNDMAGVANAVGGFVGGETGQTISQAGRVVNAIQNGNMVGAMAAAGGVVGGEAGDTIKKAAGFVYAAEHNSTTGMLAAAGALAGDTAIGQAATTAANIARAAEQQDYTTAATHALGYAVNNNLVDEQTQIAAGTAISYGAAAQSVANGIQTGNAAETAKVVAPLVGGTAGQLLNSVANAAAKPSLNSLKTLANDVKTALAAAPASTTAAKSSEASATVDPVLAALGSTPINSSVIIPALPAEDPLQGTKLV